MHADDPSATGTHSQAVATTSPKVHPFTVTLVATQARYRGLATLVQVQIWPHVRRWASSQASFFSLQESVAHDRSGKTALMFMAFSSSTFLTDSIEVE